MGTEKKRKFIRMYRKKAVKEKTTKEKLKQAGKYLLFVVGVFTYMADIYSDYALCITYFLNLQYWYGTLTLSFTIIPQTIMSVYFANLYVYCFYPLLTDRIRLRLKFFVMFLMMPIPLFYFFLWTKFNIAHHDYRCQSQSWNPWKPFTMVTTIKVTIVLLEVFFESVPQLSLQVYIILKSQGFITRIQHISCFISLFAASCGLINQFEHGFVLKLIVFVINNCWFLSRVIVIALMGCVSTSLPFICMGFHYFLCLLFWFYDKKNIRDVLTRKHVLQELCVNVLLFAACSTFTPLLTQRNFELGTFLLIENIIAYLLLRNNAKIAYPTSQYYTTVPGNISAVVIDVNTTSNVNGLQRRISYVYLHQWQSKTVLMLVFVACNIVAYFPILFNFVLLLCQSKYYVRFNSQINKLLKVRTPKLIKKAKKKSHLKDVAQMGVDLQDNSFVERKQAADEELQCPTSDAAQENKQCVPKQMEYVTAI